MIIKVDIAPVLPNSKVVTKALGISATIPAKIIENSITYTPRVICSLTTLKKLFPQRSGNSRNFKENTRVDNQICDDSKPTDNP